MPMRQHVYPLDLTMTLASNYIVNEVKQINTPADRLFVPNAGPFYTESMIIKTNSGRILQPITEYKLLYMNEDATLASNRNVCTVVQILNDSLPDVILEYRVIGGEYGDTVYGILQELAKVGPVAQYIDWKTNIYNKPSSYPPAPHYHQAGDFTDWDKVWVELDGIRKAIIVGDEQSWAAVFRYFNRRVEFIEANISNNVLSNVNTVLTGYAVKSDLNNFYTKTQIDFMIKDFAASSKFGDYYTKKQVDDKFIPYMTTAEVNSHLSTYYYNKNEIDAKLRTIEPKISRQAGNLLEMRSDGLYYGIEAPPDLSNLYVDALHGDDNNPGSKEQPLRTFARAVEMTPSNMSNTIWLKTKPDDSQWDSVYRYTWYGELAVTGGAIRRIKPYGHYYIDGQGWKNVNADAQGIFNPVYTNLITRPPLWLRWSYSTEGINQVGRIGRFRVMGGAQLIIEGVDIVVDFNNNPLPNYPMDWYHVYISVFTGNDGAVSLHGLNMIKCTALNHDTNDYITLAKSNRISWFTSLYEDSITVNLIGTKFAVFNFAAGTDNGTHFNNTILHKSYSDGPNWWYKAYNWEKGPDGQYYFLYGLPPFRVTSSRMSISSAAGVVNWPTSYSDQSALNKWEPSEDIRKYNMIDQVVRRGGFPINIDTNFLIYGDPD